MSTLFAYHKTYANGPFSQTYYFTKKKHPKVGDIIYVISGDGPRAPRYFLEGLYVVSGILQSQNEKNRELLLKVLMRCETSPCISEQRWFKRKQEQFNNIFVKGLNLNPVPPDYEQKFNKILAENGGAVEYYTNADAINDIHNGSDHPQKRLGRTSYYSRDPAVRRAVLLRAHGSCEYCGRSGFICVDGTVYLESHHIIALADDGADRRSNLIALCPEDHRRAHFGKDRDEIERKMLEVVRRLAGSSPI